MAVAMVLADAVCIQCTYGDVIGTVPTRCCPKPLPSRTIVAMFVPVIATRRCRFGKILKVRGVKLCPLHITGKIQGDKMGWGTWRSREKIWLRVCSAKCPSHAS